MLKVFLEDGISEYFFYKENGNRSDIQKVWETVTSLEKYTWRSDLSKIEI